ncbi:rCG62131 [Rattus norvegicus]|uniref:RCG62131 n=1 Tax=Rattus norvegicus TaxID=10116 RepID=A6H9X9_RAT|nr:rCG62131 [Rattus norvegicus]
MTQRHAYNNKRRGSEKRLETHDSALGMQPSRGIKRSCLNKAEGKNQWTPDNIL